MPRQNRVSPFGEIIAVPDRGLFMGNRGGCMHTADGQLTSRRWCNKRWITCVLEFKGRRRTLMSPGQYTELFFLDEATALSAGHRPCCECRRGDYPACIRPCVRLVPRGPHYRGTGHGDRDMRQALKFTTPTPILACRAHSFASVAAVANPCHFSYHSGRSSLDLTTVGKAGWRGVSNCRSVG